MTIRILIAAIATVTLAFPNLTVAQRDPVCDGLSGAAKGLCNAYCVAQNCDEHPSTTSCISLRLNFEKQTGSSTFPCDGAAPTSTSTATAAATNTSTPTLVPPSVTPTFTATVGTVEPTATETPENTNTPTGKDTPTELPATPTFTATAGTVEPTATETPENTNIPTGTDTPTELPATPTFTATVGTVEPTATETPENTNTPTNTDTPTELPATPTFTATVGTVEPTATETPEDTPTNTPTEIPSTSTPTFTVGTLEPTATETATFTPTATFTVGTAGETAEEALTLRQIATLRGKFNAHLSGRQEVPPVDTNAQGQVTLRLSRTGDELRYKLIVANIDDVTQAHIHCGPAGVNGSVTVFLFNFVAGGVSVNGQLASGTITGANVMPVPDSAQCPGGIADFDDLIDKISSGGAYVNVHTVAHPGGEIRGQL